MGEDVGGGVRREHSSGFRVLFQWCFPQENDGIADCFEELGLKWEEGQHQTGLRQKHQS